jgi:Protein of unknown function (DUF4038)/Domain of unknown function (DUF5060)
MYFIQLSDRVPKHMLTLILRLSTVILMILIAVTESGSARDVEVTNKSPSRLEGLVADSLLSTEKGQMGELVFTVSNVYVDPFDVTLHAIFSKDGRSYGFWGFYAGANTWKVRYNLNDTGTWNYSTLSSDDQLNGKSGSVSIVSPSPSNRGFLIASGRALKWENTGEPYFIMGQTAYFLFHKNLPWLQLMDWLQSNGFNHIRADLNSATQTIDGVSDLWLSGGDPSNPDFSRFNLAQWDKIDQVLQEGLRQGLTFELGTKLIEQFSHPSSQRIHFMQYLTARLGAYPHLIFSENFEIDETVRGEIVPSQNTVKSVGADFSNMFKSYPRRPLLGVHMRRNDTYHEGSTESLYYHLGSDDFPADFRDQTWLTFGSLHEKWKIDGFGFLQHRPHFSIPMYVGEPIYETTNGMISYSTSELDKWGMAKEIINDPAYYYRRYAWSALLSGGVGIAYGLTGNSIYRDNFGIVLQRWASGLPASADGKDSAVGFKDIRRALDFFGSQGIDVNQLIPDDTRINNGFSTPSTDVLSSQIGLKRAKFASVSGQNKYFAYNPYSTDLTIVGIPSGLPMRIIDPKTGNVYSIGYTSGGTQFGKPAQFSGDYVLEIGISPSPTPPPVLIKPSDNSPT